MEWVIGILITIGALYILSNFLEGKLEENQSEFIKTLSNKYNINNYQDASYVWGKKPRDPSFLADTKLLLCTPECDALLLSQGIEGEKTDLILYPDDVIEASVQNQEGEKITEITGRGVLVTVGAGLTFGVLGALVGSTTAQRRQKTKGPTKAILEIVHSKQGGPRFAIEIARTKPEELEELIADWNARLKLFMSKKEEKRPTG